MDTRGGRATFSWHLNHQEIVLQPWRWHFRGNAGSNCPPSSQNKLLHLMLKQQSSLAQPQAFETEAQKRRPISGLHGDVLGLELKRKVKKQLASVSTALWYQRSDWEGKEGEVNPACKKTIYSPRARAFTYPLQLRVNPPHAQGLIPWPRNQLVIFRA